MRYVLFAFLLVATPSLAAARFELDRLKVEAVLTNETVAERFGTTSPLNDIQLIKIEDIKVHGDKENRIVYRLTTTHLEKLVPLFDDNEIIGQTPIDAGKCAVEVTLSFDNGWNPNYRVIEVGDMVCESPSPDFVK